jgi:hypothetical protein
VAAPRRRRHDESGERSAKATTLAAKQGANRGTSTPDCVTDSGLIVVGIVMNTVAAVFVALSTVLLRRVASHAQLSPGTRLISIVITRPLWWTGIISFGVGIFRTARAFQLAPVAVAQPYAALNLVLVVVLARPILVERPVPCELIGIFMMIVGLPVSRAKLGDGAPSMHPGHPRQLCFGNRRVTRGRAAIPLPVRIGQEGGQASRFGGGGERHHNGCGFGDACDRRSWPCGRNHR